MLKFDEIESSAKFCTDGILVKRVNVRKLLVLCNGGEIFISEFPVGSERASSMLLLVDNGRFDWALTFGVEKMSWSPMSEHAS